MKSCPVCSSTFPGHHTHCNTDGALLIETREFDPGTVIRGKYRIERLLGRGGMGTVYLAEHLLMGKLRALKFISSELSQDPALLKRFRREALAASELHHPNVVQVQDLDQAEDGTPFIVMEFVEGQDLSHLLARGPLPVERSLELARGIALGLGAAHAKGVIHRDVKPANILLAREPGQPETPKLLDFGIAAVKQAATAISRTRGLMLTPEYAAPEQWNGMNAEEQDARVDLYALGGVLYEMLTGTTCFRAQTTEGWMRQHLDTQPQPPSSLRPELKDWQGLDALVLRLLAKDREQRPPSPQETVASLGSVHRLEPGPGRQTEVDQPKVEEMEPQTEEAEAKPKRNLPRRIFQRVPRLVWAALAGLAGLVAVLALLAFLLPASTISNLAGGWRSGQPSGVSGILRNLACTRGDAGSCNGLAKSSVAAKDKFRAATLYLRTCDTGDAEGCLGLDKTFLFLNPGQPEHAQVLSRTAAVFSRACDAGNLQECSFLGDAYEWGHGVARDLHRAASLFSRACDAGLADSCGTVGHLYGDNSSMSVGQDMAQAVRFYTKGCDGGDASSCGELAGIYRRGGIGASADPHRALALDSKACDAGLLKSCSVLGDMYLRGWDVAKDPSRAADFFSKACEGGHEPSCFNLGDMYATGRGVVMDPLRAKEIYSMACDPSKASGAELWAGMWCDTVGELYLKGRPGIEKDYPRAIEAFSKGCDLRDGASCHSLGDMYSQGLGVAKDESRAAAFYAKSR